MFVLKNFDIMRKEKEKNVDNKLNEISCHIKFGIDKQLSTYYITAPTVHKLLSTCLLSL